MTGVTKKGREAPHFFRECSIAGSMHSADNREIGGSNPPIPTSVGSPRVVGSERKGSQISDGPRPLTFSVT